MTTPAPLPSFWWYFGHVRRNIGVLSSTTDFTYSRNSFTRTVHAFQPRISSCLLKRKRDDFLVSNINDIWLKITYFGAVPNIITLWISQVRWILAIFNAGFLLSAVVYFSIKIIFYSAVLKSFKYANVKILSRDPGGGGGGHSHMKQTGMLVVSLRGVNFEFWSRLGYSWQSANILCHQGLV